MSSSKSGDAEFLIFLVVVALIVWLSDWVPFRSEYTTYSAACSQPEADNKCLERNEVLGSKITFKPDSNAKTVVYWVDGIAPAKFDNCAIADVKNWACQGGDMQMIDGDLHGALAVNAPGRQLSKAGWWWLKFKKM